MIPPGYGQPKPEADQVGEETYYLPWPRPHDGKHFPIPPVNLANIRARDDTHRVKVADDDVLG